MSAPFDLESLRVRYVTFRDASADERIGVAEELRRVQASERVLLETCHRVELVSVGSDPGSSVSGRAAVQRVFEVVAGFDSAVVAEEQLLGQVRGSYEAALAEGRTGPVLNELFRRALRFGRRVRSHALPGTDRSLADPGVAWLVQHLHEPTDAVVVGTGEIGRLLAAGLARAGHRVVLVSSSASRGGAVLETLPGEGHRLVIGQLSALLAADARAIALAARPRRALVTADVLGASRPWILDLSTPSAVDDAAATVLGDRLMTLDGLAPGGAARAALSPSTARRLRRELAAEVDGFIAWLATRRGGDALAVLHGEAEVVRRRHLDRLRSRARLDDRQLAAVEAASAAMLGELLHGPSLELRRGGADAATVRRLFGIDR